MDEAKRLGLAPNGLKADTAYRALEELARRRLAGRTEPEPGKAVGWFRLDPTA